MLSVEDGRLLRHGMTRAHAKTCKLCAEYLRDMEEQAAQMDEEANANVQR